VVHVLIADFGIRIAEWKAESEIGSQHGKGENHEKDNDNICAIACLSVRSICFAFFWHIADMYH
jgi:hypothetical protein